MGSTGARPGTPDQAHQSNGPGRDNPGRALLNATRLTAPFTLTVVP
jgi:hypothetical protein